MLLVEPVDVFIKLARQTGKTETVTLLLRLMIIDRRGSCVLRQTAVAQTWLDSKLALANLHDG